MFLLLGIGMVFGQSHTVFPIGNYWHFPDARSLSLGGAGSVSLAAPGAMFSNPAALTHMEHPLTAEVSLHTRKMEERRSYPLYDRFDGIVGQGIYAINNNWYIRPQGAVAFRLPLQSLPKLTVAAGSFPEIEQNYSYTEEVRDNIFGDPLVAYNRIKIDGSLQRYGIAVAGALPNFPDLSFGIQAGVLDGSLDYFKKIDSVSAKVEDMVFADVNRSLDNTPVVLSAGAIYRVNNRVTGGVDVCLPYTVKYSATTVTGETMTEEIGYPLKINAGFEYRAQQELQARLNVDIGYEFWSNVNYDVTGLEMISSSSLAPFGNVVFYNENFVDVYTVKVGIEHIFFNKIPFRVGMQYRNSYQKKGTTQTLLSAGTGFMNNNWRVDVAGAFNKVTYKREDLFSDKFYVDNPETFQSRTDLDDVDELHFFGRITLSYFLDL